MNTESVKKLIGLTQNQNRETVVLFLFEESALTLATKFVDNWAGDTDWQPALSSIIRQSTLGMTEEMARRRISEFVAQGYRVVVERQQHDLGLPSNFFDTLPDGVIVLE